MRAFVTGGTGFVGKPFVRRLLADGWDVTLSTRNRAHAEALGDVRVVEGDLADAAAMARAAEGAEPFDVVFHLGAAMNYFGDPETLRVANVEATRNVLDLAIRTGSRKFVYASSIEAVGTVARGPGAARRAVPPGEHVRGEQGAGGGRASARRRRGASRR